MSELISSRWWFHHTPQPGTSCCYVLLPVWEPEVHFQLSVIWPALNIWYLLLLTVGRISVRYLLTMNCWHLFIPFAVSSMFYGIFWEWSIIEKTQFSCKILVFTVAEKNFSWEYFYKQFKNNLYFFIMLKWQFKTIILTVRHYDFHAGFY